MMRYHCPLGLAALALTPACQMTGWLETQGRPDADDWEMATDNRSGDDVLDFEPDTPDSFNEAGDTMVLCPPSPPYGHSVGDVAADVTLQDCDGNPHTLHSLCNRKAIWIYMYSGW